MAPGTILVLYDGSEPADDLLRLACEAVGGEGLVVALYVTRVPPSLPLEGLPAATDAAGNDALDHAERVTRRYDGLVEMRLVRARRVADAVVGEAGEIGADAIFLPLARGSMWQRCRHAWTAWRIGRRASCPVLLSYQAALAPHGREDDEAAANTANAPIGRIQAPGDYPAGRRRA